MNAEDPALDATRPPPGPQGLPRRPRRTAPTPTPAPAPAPRHRDEAVHDLREGDDGEDSLSPAALAHAMVAIQRGLLRARLAEPDGSDGRQAPAHGPGSQRLGASPDADRV